MKNYNNLNKKRQKRLGLVTLQNIMAFQLTPKMEGELREPCKEWLISLILLKDQNMEHISTMTVKMRTVRIFVS